MSLWQLTNRADIAVSRLMDRHYSRQTIGARQFVRTGRCVVMYLPGPLYPFHTEACFVWWSPAPGKANRKDGFDGWWHCAAFRNESAVLSSDLIREAIPFAVDAWGDPPHGFDTYVMPSAVRSTKVPSRKGVDRTGWCFQMAGWTLTDHWTKDGKKRQVILPNGG